MRLKEKKVVVAFIVVFWHLPGSHSNPKEKGCYSHSIIRKLSARKKR